LFRSSRKRAREDRDGRSSRLMWTKARSSSEISRSRIAMLPPACEWIRPLSLLLSGRYTGYPLAPAVKTMRNYTAWRVLTILSGSIVMLIGGFLLLVAFATSMVFALIGAVLFFASLFGMRR